MSQFSQDSGTLGQDWDRFDWFGGKMKFGDSILEADSFEEEILVLGILE